MDADKKKRLEERGYIVTDATTFLGLTPEEQLLVEIRRSLAQQLRQVRQERGLTQAQTAAHLGSSQSRVAKMEAGLASVSLDLLINALVQLGATAQQIGAALSNAGAPRLLKE